ncbi:MAG: glycosyltransferase, partial [Wenzhouxiangellaceae bacterium]|nr:glycosyltransferase [Wenzhouxiangellaceae bacterium]
LPALIDALAPDAALFLSTVPETWNYSLSEMRALGLVPVATRVGSFPERIEHGVDGWLFEPTVDGLLDCIRALLGMRDRLAAMAGHGEAERTVGDMAADYARLFPVEAEPAGVRELRLLSAAGTTAARQAGQLADATTAANRARAERTRLRDELARRTRWAETMERQFRARSEWARKLDTETREQAARIVELTERHAHEQKRAQEFHGRFENTRIELEQTRIELEQTRIELEQTRIELEQTRIELEQTRADLGDRLERLAQTHEQLQAQFEQVVNSRSWKLTRPLRFVNRVLSRKRLRQAANPLQWPRMVGVFVRELRLRGLRQTLLLLQAPPIEGVAPRTELPGVGSAPEPSPDGAGAQPAPVSLPETDEPVASIVVPVFNQLHFTAGCLASLASVETRTGFEVIVVDDASGDGTPDWLAQCDGVRVVRNEENLGFIGSCNRGAAAARARFLVFLNNDTCATDGWLDALVETFDRYPDAGVVGARLVSRDGTLQEAGGIVFRDASGWNYGRGDDPDRPEYRFVSEADYVSGACLAIARELFESLGGFDDHFAPAYYEDTDLCFRVREHGRKVLYQPDSTVVHFEGGTSGTDEAAGEKRFQAVNRVRFRERWADELARFPENPGDVRPDLARAMRYRRFATRALVIDAVTPMPDHDSGSVRMFALLRLLGELGCRVSFMPQNLSWTGRHSGDLQQAGVEVLTAPWLSDPEDWLAEHGETLDLVVVSRHYVLAPLYRMLRALCPNARIVFDTVDLHFLREEREADLAGTHAARRQAEKTRRQELGLIERADATLVVSDYERELLARLVPEADVRVVSNIHVLHDPGRPFEERRDLVFVGGFQHPPNVDAAEWLIDEILPRVVERLPEMTLHLIGSRMPERIANRRAPGLQVHGFVADLEPYMSGCRISVAPLRYGAGVKGKVNQAMAHGLPVVATSCAAEGMFAVDGRDILLADDAETFAARIVELYLDRDLWNRLAEGGRRNVEQYFSVDTARRALRALLADLHGHDGSRIESA